MSTSVNKLEKSMNTKNIQEILSEKHLKSTEWGQKLTDQFGEDKAKEIVEFIRNNGFCFELPVSLTNMKLNNTPKVELKLFDSKGRDINDEECEEEIAKTHLFSLEIDGKPLPYAKSVEISKFDYTETEIATFKVEHYAIVGKPALDKEKCMT